MFSIVVFSFRYSSKSQSPIHATDQSTNTPIHPPINPSTRPVINPCSNTHPRIHPEIHSPIHPPCIYPYFHQPIIPFIHPSFHPPTLSSTHPSSTHPSIYASILHSSIHLSTYPFINPPILSLYPSIHTCLIRAQMKRLNGRVFPVSFSADAGTDGTFVFSIHGLNHSSDQYFINGRTVHHDRKLLTQCGSDTFLITCDGQIIMVSDTIIGLH